MTKPTRPGGKPREDVREIEGHRQPTPAEIRFGYGATHYRTFPVAAWLRPDGTLKRRIVADDGLTYSRG